MDATPLTPFQTPQRIKSANNSASLSTPLLVPPSPMLQQMGFGTGVHIYRIERSPKIGKTLSPWVVKRVRGRTNASDEKQLISSRLLDEATILKSLDHPNIVGYRGSKTLSDDRIILAMETCDTSLGDQIETRVEQSLGPLESVRIKKMAMDVCKALDYLHNKAYVLHGDLKSYNVLIKGDFELCKLCDFGVSLPLTADGSVDVAKNPKAKYTGTDLWSAPEVFNDNIEDITTKTDMFSFGLIIYECVALQAPHAGYTADFDFSQSDNDVSQSNNENSPPPAKQAKKLFSELNETDLSVNTEVSSTNATLDETDESSILIKSTAATMGDSTADAIENYLGTRPPIPDVYDLPEDYNVVLEIFFLCTNELPENRPDASYLAKHLATIIEEDEEDDEDEEETVEDAEDVEQ